MQRSQEGNILFYMVTGIVLGTIFSLLLIWPFTSHIQYLKSKEVYYFSFIGAIGGVIGGLFVNLLNPKRKHDVLAAIMLGLIYSTGVMWLLAPLPNLTPNLTTNWLYYISPVGLLGGAISGLLIGKLNLTHKLDMTIRETLIPVNDRDAKKSFLTLTYLSGIILGGTVGAILTVVAVIIYILFTPDPYQHTFDHIRNYYFLIPIGSLVGWAYLSLVKSPAVKIIHLMINGFSEGITFGVLTGIIIEVLLVIVALFSWINFEADNALLFYLETGTIFSVVIALASAVFGVCVSLVNNALVALVGE